jgi:hypothetical protein
MDMSWLSSGAVQTAIGALVGALVTWWVARIYYVKASEDLAKESEELRRQSVLMLRGLEVMAEKQLFGRDELGNPQGVYHGSSGDLEGS